MIREMQYENKNDRYEKNILAAIQFYSTEPSQKFSYAIRDFSYNQPDPMVAFPFKQYNGPRSKYSGFSGANYDDDRRSFSSVQTLLNEAYLSYKAAKKPGGSRPKTGLLIGHKAPYPPYLESKFYMFSLFIPLIVNFGFIVTFPIIVKRLTEEKNNRLVRPL